MRLHLLLSACLLSLMAAPAYAAGEAVSAKAASTAALRERALADGTAWQVVESLTTEVGPRLAGSEADARAVAWAQDKFRELGYDRVWTEPVTFPKWERRGESAQVLGATAQPLVVTALGGSPGGTVEAEIVRFDSLEALQAAAAGSLAGRIAFVDSPMARARDGGAYGKSGAIRSRGPSEAIRKGAAAFLMRSAGTSEHRVANTGITRFDEGLTPVPAAALSLPDADQLARLLARGPVRVRLALDCGWDGEYTSHNVIGEITGREAPQVVVLLGAHLDSWDLGTGAIDDASGIGITMAAGHLLGQLPQRPRRTIRVVAFANEEHEKRLFAVDNANYRTTKLEAYKLMAFTNALNYVSLRLTQMVVMVAGSYFVPTGQLTAGGFVGFLLLVNVFVRPIEKINSVIETYPKGIAGFRRYLEFLDTEPDVVDRPNAVAVTGLRGDIRYENVSFAYKGTARPVLSGIDLAIRAGETVAFVGPSGAGKTTLCSL